MPEQNISGQNISDQQLAEKIVESMYERDMASKSLGFAILEVRPGYAQLTMTVRDDMVNGYDICHGGLTYALADTAFAFASNSENNVTVTQNANISYLAPAHKGDVVTAIADVQHQQGRTGVCDVVLTNQDGVKIALYRGTFYRLNKPMVPDLPHNF